MRKTMNPRNLTYDVQNTFEDSESDSEGEISAEQEVDEEEYMNMLAAIRNFHLREHNQVRQEIKKEENEEESLPVKNYQIKKRNRFWFENSSPFSLHETKAKAEKEPKRLKKNEDEENNTSTVTRRI